jgi:hypothetical protein
MMLVKIDHLQRNLRLESDLCLQIVIEDAPRGAAHMEVLGYPLFVEEAVMTTTHISFSLINSRLFKARA